MRRSDSHTLTIDAAPPSARNLRRQQAYDLLVAVAARPVDRRPTLRVAHRRIGTLLEQRTYRLRVTTFRGPYQRRPAACDFDVIVRSVDRLQQQLRLTLLPEPMDIDAG